MAADGVRAVLIEKNHKPKWEPASLEDVTRDVVESYFQPFEDTSKEYLF